MRRALLAACAVLFGCEDPIFLDCDGGRIETRDGAARCAVLDGGADAARTDGGCRPGEERAEAPDAPDCFDELECPVSSRHVIDLSETASVTVEGRLDGSDHTLTFACGPRAVGDRDVYRVLAPARTFVEVTLERQLACGRLRPVLETWDPSGRCQSGFAEGEPLRSVFLIASPSGLPSFVQIMHEAAYHEDACGDATWRGGEGYGYRATFRRCDDCAIEELGALGAEDLIGEARLERPGDLAVFRFTAEPDANPGVTITSSCPSELGGACMPALVALRPAGGGAHLDYCDLRTSTTDLPASGEERLVSVLDFEGRGAPGYRVTVRVSR